MKLFIFAWALALVTTVQAQSNLWQADWGLTSAQLQNEFDTLVPQGYRLNYVSGYTELNVPLFAAIWEQKASVAWVAHTGLTFAQFQQYQATYQSQKYRPIVVNGYTVDGVDYYAGIWDQSPATWFLGYGYTAAEYQTALDTYKAQNYTLKHVSGYARGFSALYAAIWELTNDGIGWVTAYGLTDSGYASESQTYVDQGYRLVLICGYRENIADYFAAIWDLSVSGLWVEEHDLTSSELTLVSNSYVSLGYRLKIVSGYDIGLTVLYAALWIK